MLTFGVVFSEVDKATKGNKLNIAWQNFVNLFSSKSKKLLANTSTNTSDGTKTEEGTQSPVNPSTPNGNQPQEESILFLFAGESNAGNQVHNDRAMPNEIGLRNLQILNNSTLTFEQLNIGVNNSIDQRAAPADSHGWDLGLANLVDSGIFGGKRVFLVNLSQGGSLIGQYNEGADTNYRNKIIARANAAMTALRAISNNITVYMVYSHGINDEVANIVNESQFQSMTQNHLSFLESQFGSNLKLVMTKFEKFPKFNQSIQNIVNGNGRYRAIETAGLSLQDTYHWGYDSQKYIITQSVNLLKSI